MTTVPPQLPSELPEPSPTRWDDIETGAPDPAQAQARIEQTEQQRRQHALDEQTLAERVRREARRRVDAEETANPPEAATRKIRLTPASHFKIKKVRWVWQGRMPLGEITLIPGREGVGKSTFLAWQAAMLTRGELPGEWFGTKKPVLYAATEDSWEHTIAPRMLAAGADMDLVYRIDVELVDVGKATKLILPMDTSTLATAAREVQAAALMCDPVISVISDQVNTFKAQELRSALEPLRVAAEQAEMAVTGLVHFNKAKDTDVLTSISGSRAWTEVARAVIAIARDPDAEQYTCVVSQVKNNLGRLDLPNLAYTIASTSVETDDGDHAEVGAVRWTSDAYAKGVEDLINPPKEKKRSDAQQKIIDFVMERFEETGAGVATAEVVRRWGGEMTKANITQHLARLAKEGTLRRIGHGLYGPPEDEVRPCPGCGVALAPGANFCGGCRKRLDRDDRTQAVQDTLY